MNPLWIIIVTLASVVGGTSLSFWLLAQTRQIKSSRWILQHIICPIIRLLVLLIIVSQLYPAIDAGTSSLEFWRLLAQQKHFSNLLNILFFGSLLLGFLPLLNHAAFALPLQSCFSMALVFHWQYPELGRLALLPPSSLWLLIAGYMLIAFFVARESSIRIARRLDKMLNSSDSIRLVGDAIYLLLQIPVMLFYGEYLRQLLPA